MTEMYCTVQDVRNALTPGGSSEDNTEAGKTAATLPAWQIEDAIVEAMTIVDLYVKARYQITIVDVTEPVLPPTEPPTVDAEVSVAPQPIRMWTRTIAAYYATLTFREGKDLEERDPIQLRYDSVMQLLSGVRTGTFDLVLDPVDSTAGAVEIFNVYEGTMFTLDDFGLVQTGSGRHHTNVTVPVYPW